MRILPFRSISVVAVIVLVTLLSPAEISVAQVRKLYPVDEAAKNPSFFVFRARLFKAIQQRDTAFLVSILSPKIISSFGGTGGIAEFKEMWKLSTPGSKVWSELGDCLALGGKFDKDGSYTAPYIFGFPEDMDPYEHAAVINENVNVRSQPRTDSPVLKTLSFDIVKVIKWDRVQTKGDRRAWLTIQLDDGKQGFISDEFVRSPIDFRATFEKINGKWLMTSFVAGD
jgi:hypothetical protein